jgi:hypothetical protein
MTKPITHRPLERAGRKPIAPPVDAAENIRAHAADGWSVLGIAHCMSVNPRTLKRWMEENPILQDAFDLGREQERRTLHNMVYRRAVEHNDVTAAMCLLNSRHGYRSDQSDQGNRVNVTIALPGAMTLQQFTSIGKETANG